MGLCTSSDDNARAEAAWQYYGAIVNELGLNQAEFKGLYLGFRRACVKYGDGTEDLDYDAFIARIGLDNSRFSQRVFRVLDNNQSGRIGFAEFLVALWSYCSCDESSLIHFAFSLYDNDSSGQIQLSELYEILKEVYGDHPRKLPQLQKVIARLDDNSGVDPLVNDVQFAEFCRKTPGFLFPAFQLQRHLRKEFMGIRFWERAASRRIGRNLSRQEWRTKLAVLHEKLRRGSEVAHRRKSLDPSNPPPSADVITPQRRPSMKGDGRTVSPSNNTAARRPSSDGRSVSPSNATARRPSMDNGRSPSPGNGAARRQSGDGRTPSPNNGAASGRRPSIPPARRPSMEGKPPLDGSAQAARSPDGMPTMEELLRSDASDVGRSRGSPEITASRDYRSPLGHSPDMPSRERRPSVPGFSPDATGGANPSRRPSITASNRNGDQYLVSTGSNAFRSANARVLDESGQPLRRPSTSNGFSTLSREGDDFRPPSRSRRTSLPGTLNGIAERPSTGSRPNRAVADNARPRRDSGSMLHNPAHPNFVPSAQYEHARRSEAAAASSSATRGRRRSLGESPGGLNDVSTPPRSSGARRSSLTPGDDSKSNRIRLAPLSAGYVTK